VTDIERHLGGIRAGKSEPSQGAEFQRGGH
jgi:hypothetical protein